MTTETPDSVEQLAPSVTIEAADRYLIGLPMMIAVICKNTTDRSTFYFLPACDPFTPPRPFTFTMKRQRDEATIDFPDASLPHGEGIPAGFTLGPGEARRMLCDLSLYNMPLAPGAYRLDATYHTRQDIAEAPPVDTELAAPSPDAEAVLDLLRSVNDRDEPSWGHFIRYNWRTIYLKPPVPHREVAALRAIDATELAGESKEALAFHLFLHRATYGPKKVAALNPRSTEAFAHGPLAGEAAVLRYEMLVARDDASVAEERKKLLNRFPGLQWRVEAIEAGNGRLARLRRMYGAEQDFTTAPDFFPYTSKR